MWTYVVVKVLLVVFFVYVAVLAVGFWTGKIQKYICEKNATRFSAAAREARKAEKERKKELTRIAKQNWIGNEVLWTLQELWRLAGCPLYRSIFSNQQCGEAKVYYIQVGPPPHIRMVVTVDFRQRPERRVEVACGLHVQWPDAYSAPRQVRYLAQQFKIFED